MQSAEDVNCAFAGAYFSRDSIMEWAFVLWNEFDFTGKVLQNHTANFFSFLNGAQLGGEPGEVAVIYRRWDHFHNVG